MTTISDEAVKVVALVNVTVEDEKRGWEKTKILTKEDNVIKVGL